MSRSESLAEYLRAQGRWRLDRVEREDGGRNARSALALLDAAAYADTLADDDPLVEGLAMAGCFGPAGFDDFDPGPRGLALIRSWEAGEPWQLLLAVRNTLLGSLA
ncbi:hypothetical protein Misp01_30640 [Microtetraspora sp. NBRC 13810]|uniref:hypothetical protein n=1 Tax=Microtetraspora sp. NBRC 13810 TaxID=3030990 RepID=UPI0024A2E8A2|nr:hypothetical protein [Microtetraspora sp. NBRC 13810]GLW07934.1 hypothetical protein Misp01_30640 [Microtetraspora sp. NBRC 13810]